MRAVGLLLVLLGALALGYQGFTYVTRERVVDAGAIQVTADRERTVWVPPVVGAVAVGGLVLLTTGGRRAAA